MAMNNPVTPKEIIILLAFFVKGFLLIILMNYAARVRLATFFEPETLTMAIATLVMIVIGACCSTGLKKLEEKLDIHRRQ